MSLTDNRAITTMRETTPAAAQFPIYVHNGFDLERFTDYVASRTDFVVQDHHSYFVFTPSDDAEPAAQHTSDIHGPVMDTLAKASEKQHRNLVIDEWSCALTPKSIANEPDKPQARKNFCTGQLDAYTNTTAGWSFWCTYWLFSFLFPTLNKAFAAHVKEECDDDPGWCFKAAVGTSLASTFFSYRRGQMDDWQSQSSMDTVANMTSPSDSDVLAKLQQDARASPGGQRASLSEDSPRTRELRHRFEAIRLRHRNQDPFQRDWTSIQRSMLQGYIKGFDTGKTFALKGGFSKLGFIEQYILDNIAQESPSVIGLEVHYRRGFVRGLQDVEEMVQFVFSAQSQPP